MTWMLIKTVMTLQRVPGIPMGDCQKIEVRNAIIENTAEVSITQRGMDGYRWVPREQVLEPIGMVVVICRVFHILVLRQRLWYIFMVRMIVFEAIDRSSFVLYERVRTSGLLTYCTFRFDE